MSDAQNDGQPNGADNNTGDAPQGDASATGADQLGDGGKKALDAERAARKAAEARIREFEQAASEAEKAKLGDTERLTLERDEHKSGRETAEAKALRYSVALDKGLSKTLAKRLVGKTREELEADADELLSLTGGGPATGERKPPAGKAREALPRGGGDPTGEVEETDPAKLAAKIPRR